MSIQIGSVVLNQQMVTQLGNVTAAPGTKLVSVFLGAVKKDQDPEPERRLRRLGFRQMEFYRVESTVECHDRDMEYHLVYSSTDPKSAVEEAIRFVHSRMTDEFSLDEPETAAPIINEIVVSVVEIGCIDKEGNPHRGVQRDFFFWDKSSPLTLNEHLNEYGPGGV